MKKLFGKSFLALVLAMTMLMGMSMTVMAGTLLPDKYGELYATYVVGGVTSSSWDAMGSEVYCAHNWRVVNGDGTINSIRIVGEPTGLVSELPSGTYEVKTDAGLTCGCKLVLSKPTPTSSHTHNYEWNTLVDPTTESDGVEAYICSCGDIQATQPISAAHNILKVNADAVKNAKAGATVVVELGRLNSLPRWFVTKLVERDDLNVTLKITYNHENYTLEVPKTATIEDKSIEWYGPLKLMSMFLQK